MRKSRIAVGQRREDIAVLVAGQRLLEECGGLSVQRSNCSRLLFLRADRIPPSGIGAGKPQLGSRPLDSTLACRAERIPPDAQMVMRALTRKSWPSDHVVNRLTRWPSRWPTKKYKLYIYFSVLWSAYSQMAKNSRTPLQESSERACVDGQRTGS